ncbi:MAG: FlgO family outer membrane protein [Elusimicrobiales bacterium]|nr:FlgO family outer membrane protein [Elusimicrobiales bacterium]
MKKYSILLLAALGCGCAAPAIYNAAGQGDLTRVQALLASGTDPNEHSKYYANETALHEAVIYSHPEVARYLLEHGADPNAEASTNILGHFQNIGTPLMYASCKGQTALVQLLLEHGADPDPKPGICVRGRYSQPDGDEGTPLQVAEKRGHSVVAQLLKSAISSRLGLTTGTARNADAYGPLVGALLKDYKGGGRTIAVTGFTRPDGRATADGTVVAERVTTELIRQKRLTVVERKAIEKVLSELKLQLSGIDADSTRKLGKMLGADLLVVGTVTELPGSRLEVNLRLASVESGEAISAVSGQVAKDWLN